jgi:holo-[acyl-carrier protein] synthase
MVIVKSVVQDIQRFNLTLLLSNETTVFSNYEREYCSRKGSPVASLAGIWCAKAALMDALAQFAGFPAYAIAEFEIRHEQNGRPKLELSDRITLWCEQKSITFDVSISHAGEYAAAIALIRSPDEGRPEGDVFSQKIDRLYQTMVQL